MTEAHSPLLAPAIEKATRQWLEDRCYEPSTSCFFWAAAVSFMVPSARIAAGAAWWPNPDHLLGIEAWGCIPNPRDRSRALITGTRPRDIYTAMTDKERPDFNGHTWVRLNDGTLVDQLRRRVNPEDFYYEVPGLARALTKAFAPELRSLRARITLATPP